MRRTIAVVVVAFALAIPTACSSTENRPAVTGPDAVPTASTPSSGSDVAVKAPVPSATTVALTTQVPDGASSTTLQSTKDSSGAEVAVGAPPVPAYPTTPGQAP